MKHALQFVGNPDYAKENRDEVCLLLATLPPQELLSLMPVSPINTQLLKESKTQSADLKHIDLAIVIIRYQFLLNNKSPDVDIIRTGDRHILANTFSGKNTGTDSSIWSIEHSALLVQFYENEQNIFVPLLEFKSLFTDEINTQSRLYADQKRQKFLAQQQTSQAKNPNRFMATVSHNETEESPPHLEETKSATINWHPQFSK